MHVVSNPSPFTHREIFFPAGKFLIEDRSLGELLLFHPDQNLKADEFHASTEPNESQSIVVAGGMGLGDGIMLTPVLREIKRLCPDHKIQVACFPKQRQVFENLPYVDGFVDWPMTLEEYGNHTVHFIEGFDRHHPKAFTHHNTEVFADICGVPSLGMADNLKPDYKPTRDEILTAIANFPRVPGRRRIGIQVQASHHCRTYKLSQILDLLNILIPESWEAYLMGDDGEYAVKEAAKRHLYDSRTLAPSFRESCAFLTTCDVFLGPDSGFLHAAGAMDIPAVGLFAVFPWKLRTAYYSSVFAIQSGAECGPCFHSPTKLQPTFPKPHCQQAGFCTALAEIDPERIKAKLLQVAR